ncbi:OmpA family protein [Mangrovimonas aestuarii]|uniref:OmpA family protein n=1 Tax=Mangrovimonas aestuarii TaxID=3018443 RepID=UPI00237990D8|nr:OmpA family protein [Mangrovimonas aestuarii]
MNKITTVSFLFYCQLFFSQNLVLNPSFEDHKFCPELIGSFQHGVKNWTTPQSGSSDYFNTCSKEIGSDNFNGEQSPRSGNGYAGFYAYSPNNYREYIQGTLSDTLENGTHYEITFYVSLAELSNTAIKNFGIYFTENKPQYITSERPINASRISEKVHNVSFIPFFSEHYFNDKSNWIKVSCTYVAKGFETHFIIGNFESNYSTSIQKLEKNGYKQAAYYYIDDVSITPKNINETKETSIKKPVSNFQEGELYTLKNVQFEFDKAQIMKGTEIELNNLYNHLSANKNLQLEIFGHTDNKGSDAYNQELSTNRAKAIADYLIEKGIEPSKIKYIGYGSSKPIANNKTEEGRTKNRRVEFKINNYKSSN